jgi:hypothetical protein
MQEVILFDLLFISQHYVLYPEERENKVVTAPREREPFIGSSGKAEKAKVNE